jgi:aerobic-type carbon monoxide dehydrogenase small subunit (CoxS/CutS family)
MNTPPRNIHLTLDGKVHPVPVGITVAAALSLRADGTTRNSVQGERRAAFCGMGICQECRVLINGQRRLACQTLCTQGMVVRTDAGEVMTAVHSAANEAMAAPRPDTREVQP